MNKLLLLVIALLFTTKTYAHTTDSSRSMLVGDSVIIAKCPKDGFKYIQYYKKTRFPNPNATYNKTTGDDFYESFFLDGDFDAKALPCEFGNKKYKIISIKIFADKTTGADRPVMFLELAPNTVAWVEVAAVAAVEVYVE